MIIILYQIKTKILNLSTKYQPKVRLVVLLLLLKFGFLVYVLLVGVVEFLGVFSRSLVGTKGLFDLSFTFVPLSLSFYLYVNK